jgi:hypothetical protein
VGTTNGFNRPERGSVAAAFLIKVRSDGTLAFQGTGDNNSKDATAPRAFVDAPGWRLFGGFSEAAASSVAVLRRGEPEERYLLGGMIRASWSEELMRRPPTSSEAELNLLGHAFLVRTDRDGLWAGDRGWIQSFGHRIATNGVSEHLWASRFNAVAATPDQAIVAAGWDNYCAAVPGGPCTHPFVARLPDTGAPPCSCADGLLSEACGETGVDCGGPCGPCTSCFDCVKNGSETGVDCGGGHAYSGETCPACGAPPSHCPASCNDGVKNGEEQGVDCGGPCPSCVPTGAELFANKCSGCHRNTGCGSLVLGYPANAGANDFNCVNNQILNPKGRMPLTLRDAAQIQAVFEFLRTGLNPSACAGEDGVERCTNGDQCQKASSGHPVQCEGGVCFRCRLP